ncbi:MAG: hypothetical protein AB1716_04360 [Planctomycetota bacterium]
MIQLGDPYDISDPAAGLAGQLEAPVLMIEERPGGGVFEAVPWWAGRFTISTRAQTLNTCEIDCSIAPSPAAPATSKPLIDWVMGGGFGEDVRAADLLLSRRVRIMTLRTGHRSRDWLLFEGIIEKCEFAWNGESRHSGRSLKLRCVDLAVVTDRDPSQFLWGQWRRTQFSELKIIEDPSETGALTRQCCRVGVPLIFNPGGKANCHPRPLIFESDVSWNGQSYTTKVYVPCDVDMEGALPWTLAKMLRYVQWAAMQPAPPTASPPRDRYDVEYTSHQVGVRTLETTQWVPRASLRHANLNELVEADIGADMSLLESPPDNGQADPRLACLLRALPDVTVEGMSVFEAFCHLADRAGMLFHTWHLFDDRGVGTTQFQFSVRGHTRSEYSPSVEQQSNQYPDGWAPNLMYGRNVSPDGRVTREQWLHLASDPEWTTGAGGPERREPATVVQALTESMCTQGAVLLDTSSVRSFVRVQAGAAVFEQTVDLVPGWISNSDWDVNTGDPNAVNAAIAAVGGEAWLAKYGVQGVSGFLKVGRLWVLNEDGAFPASRYARACGPWKEPDVWLPYPFWTETPANSGKHQVEELRVRRDKGWSCRRRRFLNTAARLFGNTNENDNQGASCGVVVEVSSDSGATWYLGPRCAVQVDRCAIHFTEELEGWRFADGQSFPEAYIRGTLRVRVTASIEGDDAAWGFAREPFQSCDFTEVLDRRGKFSRLLRYKSRNALVASSTGLYARPADVDDTAKMDAAAWRAMWDHADVRASAHVTFPYLLARREKTAWPTYDVGDEVLGLKTWNPRSTLRFKKSESSKAGAPRVVAVEHRYASGPRAEIATVLQIESSAFGLDDQVAPGPEVQKLPYPVH